MRSWHLAAQRTHEIGVRMALGATRGHVMTMFLRHSATLAFIGLALGAAGAWSLSSTAEAFLFQIEPTDWRITATLVVLALCAVTAGAIPARRAARVDPLVALAARVNRTVWKRPAIYRRAGGGRRGYMAVYRCVQRGATWGCMHVRTPRAASCAAIDVRGD